MSRPTKFEVMRRNRHAMRTVRLREEARELGYDEAEEDEALFRAAQRELDAMRQPSSVVFGRNPKPRRTLWARWGWTIGLR